MYYIAINNKLTPVTAKTLRGAKIQATRRGADVVYETRESDRKDRYTGEDVNALIAVTRKASALGSNRQRTYSQAHKP